MKPEEVSNTLHNSAYKKLMNGQDYEYLSPIIRQIERERKERLDLEAMTITKPKIPTSAKSTT